MSSKLSTATVVVVVLLAATCGVAQKQHRIPADQAEAVPLPTPCKALQYPTARLVEVTTYAGNATGDIPIFLYRGSAPTGENHTVMLADDLLLCMQQIAQELGFTHWFPNDTSQVYLLDVNLQNPIGSTNELHDFMLEANYFANSTEQMRGEVLHWLTVGDDVDPQTLPQDQLERLAKSLGQWQADSLVWRVERLQQFALSGPKLVLPRVDGYGAIGIYVHCTGGKDRTGETVGAYALRYHRYKFAQVVAMNTAIAGRPIGTHQYNALKWYCYYLKYGVAGDYASLDCAVPNQ